MTPSPTPAARRALLVVSLTSAVFGGLLAWAGLFGGLGVAALGIGAPATLIPICSFALRDTARRPLAFMLGYAFAFALLTRPILWLAVGYVRYLLTGKSFGD